MESFTKRVAVSIYEDSSSLSFNRLFSILAGALLAQRVRNWTPTKELLISWLKLGLLGWETKTAYKVNYREEVYKKPYVLNSEQHILKNASAILDELKSFPTDLGLVRGWARDYPNIIEETAKSTPEVMPLCHCVDQHWAPQIAHYFNPEIVKKVTVGHKMGQPFEKLFNFIYLARICH